MVGDLSRIFFVALHHCVFKYHPRVAEYALVHEPSFFRAAFAANAILALEAHDRG